MKGKKKRKGKKGKKGIKERKLKLDLVGKIKRRRK